MYPLGGFTNYLQSNNIPEIFHFLDAAMCQSSMSPIDLSSKETPSPAKNDLVEDVDAQGNEIFAKYEDDTLQDVRTDKHLKKNILDW